LTISSRNCHVAQIGRFTLVGKTNWKLYNTKIEFEVICVKHRHIEWDGCNSWNCFNEDFEVFNGNLFINLWRLARGCFGRRRISNYQFLMHQPKQKWKLFLEFQPHKSVLINTSKGIVWIPLHLIRSSWLKDYNVQSEKKNLFFIPTKYSQQTLSPLAI